MSATSRCPAWFAFVLLGIALALSGCKTSAEKAEAYYQSAMSLLQNGDETRALIEFRNVFDYDGFHKPARMAYADTLLRRGDTHGAYAQYLRLIEQYPDTAEVRRTLAELALDFGNWPEVERHGRAALKLTPDLPQARAIGLALDYRASLLARDPNAAAQIYSLAQSLLTTLPNSLVLRRILINHLMKGPNPQAARTDIDAVIAQAPLNFDFQLMRLRLLGIAEDTEGAGKQLQIMVKLFPEAEQLKTSLIRWYMLKSDFKGAEAFLRQEAGAITANPKAHLAVVQLLNTTQNPAAARAELDRLIAANAGTPHADLYAAFAATLAFESGKTTEAIAAMDRILSQATDSDQSRNIMAMLARMLDETDDHARAETLVANILTDDPNNSDALKQRASWRIESNQIASALIDLRAAQNQSPRDPQIMTLMAAAYQRDGEPDLAGEQLAKAFEASNSAPDESLRYARHLRQQQRGAVAEIVLIDAQRRAPSHLAVLSALADVLLENGKWLQASQIASTLHRLDGAESLATQLDAAVLLRQNRLNDALAMLESIATQANSDAKASIVVALTQLRAGKYSQARSFITTALGTHPNDRQLRLLSANVEAMLGQPAQAETAYRALIAQDPKSADPVRLLYGLLLDTNRQTEANSVLDAGLAASPDNQTLLWIKANALEKAQKIDAALAIYDRLYANGNSGSVQANNLASLLSNYRDDRASLEQAATIARRLRGSSVPAFQDTLGWIEARRGNLDAALALLEPAARALPNDALAQYHLGILYADLGRTDVAIPQLRRALELGKASDLPQLALAQKRLLDLTTKP